MRRVLIVGACLMAFFGPGGLTGKSEQGLDPQLMQALISQFPGLEGLRGQGGQQQPPKSLGSLGYQWGGPTLYSGQGSNSFTLSPFEGAGGVSPESITAGLASGTFGKSASQQSPFGGQALGQGDQQSLLSLPSLQLPMAQVAAQQGGISGGDMMGGGSGGGEESGGFTIGAGDVLGAGQKALDIFGGDTQGQQTTTPGFAEQRAGERQDFGGAPGALPTLPMLQSQGLGSAAQASGAQFGELGMNQSTLPGYVPQPGVGGGGPTFDLFGEGVGDQSMAAPGGSADFALGGQGATDWMGAAQSGIGALGGLYNLYGGIQGGDPLSASAGGLQAIGGASSLLQNAPGLAASLGIDAGGAALSGVGGAVGGLGGLYGLYQGIQSGDPIQMATGALSAYQGGMSLVGAITGETAPGILTGLATIAPETSAAVASALTGTTIGVEAGAQGIATAISGAAAAWALPVAAVIQAVMDTIAQQERERVANAGFTNNPIKGALYSQSTESVGGVNDLLKQLGGGTGAFAGKDTYELGQGLSAGINSLMPYYQTAQGGRGAIKASDTITGAGADWAAKPYEGGLTPEQYTQNFTQANQGIAQLVNELMGRGVTYEQLGQLPVSGDWAGMSLDAGNRPEDMLRNSPNLARYQTEGSGFFGARGMNPIDSYTSGGGEGGDWSQAVTKTQDQQVQELLQSVLGASMSGPADVTNASGLMTSMYGGPLWAALARSGAGGDQGLMNLINQKFDPWVSLRGGSPAPAQPDFWGGLGEQYAQRTDPVTQQLMQYQQQLAQLQQQAPQILQGFQSSAQGAQLPPEMMAMAGGGGGAMQSGGGVDLEKLLREMGYLR